MLRTRLLTVAIQRGIAHLPMVAIGRASGRAATKKVSYIETDQEISDECEGDFD